MSSVKIDAETAKWRGVCVYSCTCIAREFAIDVCWTKFYRASRSRDISRGGIE